MIGTPRQKIQLALYVISLVLATLGIAGRLWARRITRTKWQVNDWLMILAYLNVLGLVICSNIAVTYGEMGVHISQIPTRHVLEILPFNLKMTIAMPFFLITSAFFVKMSITHFYIVLFPHTWLQKICKVQLFLLTLACIGGIIPIFVQCRPFEYTWNKFLPGGGKCMDPRKMWLGTSIVALFFDLSCVILPIPVFWSLKTSTKKKIKLTVLFSLGFFICALTVGRIYYDEKINFNDLAYSSAPAIMFTVPEPSLGIVAGCLPITVPLFARASSAVKSKLGYLNTGTTATGGTPYGTSKRSMRKQSLPLAEGKGASRGRGEDLMYPMTSVVVSRYGGEDEGREGGGPEQLRATEEMMRRCEVSVHGITVLREVEVKNEARSEFEWS